MAKHTNALRFLFKNENGLAVLGWLKGAAVLLLVLVILSFVFGRVIYPGEMGVRQISFGPNQGFGDRALAPGYHWNIPFYSKIHYVPQSLEMIHMDRNISMRPETEGALEVQTTDGSSVIVDVSILTRFYDRSGEEIVDGVTVTHGGPAELLQRIGITPERWRKTIRKVAVDELRRALGRLSTSEFYNPHKREAETDEARANMNKILAEFGAKVEAVLVRRYTYGEERIDRAIFEKNLQDQEERLNGAASKLAEAKALSEQVSAEMDAKIATLTIEGENKVRVLRSQGDLYEAEQRAKGDLAVAKAQAEVDSLKAGVLAATAGADVYVAREMAPLLSSLRGGVVADLDPYDIDAWVKRFGLGAH